MKIYTKKGDSGDTSLYGGERVSKSSSRIEVYGTVDELNSFVGLAASYGLSEKGKKYLRKVQELLLVLGADLATPASKKNRINRISDENIQFLENVIDDLDENLEPLKNFIIPGGSQAGATLHVARTICRRAERSAVKCKKTEDISELTLKFLNRLSDLFFMMARYENKEADCREETWKPDKQ